MRKKGRAEGIFRARYAWLLTVRAHCKTHINDAAWAGRALVGGRPTDTRPCSTAPTTI